MKIYKFVIQWLLAIPDHQKVLVFCFIIIGVQFKIIEKKSSDYRELENKMEITITQDKLDLKEANDKFNKFLIESNNDAQSMKDSLYMANLRTKNIQEQLNNAK